MNIDDVRAWWEENLVPQLNPRDLRELVVQKIISTYAAGTFDGARAERTRSRDLAAKHEEARFAAYEKSTALIARVPAANNVNIAANAARDRIRKSIDDMASGHETKD